MNTVSPMQGLLKSSNSSLSLLSTRTVKKTDSRTNLVPKRLPFTNVTVNSPLLKRKETNNKGDSKTKEIKDKDNDYKVNDAKTKTKNKDDVAKTLKSKDIVPKILKSKDELAKSLRNGDEIAKSGKNKEGFTKDANERQRTKTRTLDDAEIKILTPELVDNNVEMMNLTRKLAAKSKVFYVDLDDEQKKVIKHFTFRHLVSI